MGVGPVNRGGIVESEFFQYFQAITAGRRPLPETVAAGDFEQLRTDRPNRVEGGRWILKDHRHLAPAQPPPLPRRQELKSASGETQRPAQLRSGRLQAEQAGGEQRLAAPRLPGPADPFAGGDLKIESAEQTSGAGQGETEPVCFDQRRHHA